MDYYSPEEYLKEAGLRCAKERKAIVRMLRETAGHYNAAGLHRQLVDKGKKGM